MRLFYQKGYTPTTIREISQESRLTPGAIYNHFRSKDDILYSIIRWSHDELDRDVDEALDLCPTAPTERLRAAVRAFVFRHTRFPEAARVTNREYGALASARRLEIVERRRQIRSLFQRLITDAMNLDGPEPRGDGGRDVTDQITAMAVINMMIMVAEWYREGGALNAEAVAEHHADLVVRLVMNRVA